MLPARNNEGYLKDWRAWDESLIPALAHEEGIQLNDVHWAIIRWVRSFYEQFQTTPPLRIVIKHMKSQFGTDKDSLYLQQLFPGGPALQAAKLAGLPKPKKCL